MVAFMVVEGEEQTPLVIQYGSANSGKLFRRWDDGLAKFK